MASNAFICAQDNIFNKAILGEDAVYFSSADEVCAIVESTLKKENGKSLLSNKEKVSKIYAWETIISQYEVFKRQFEKVAISS